MYFSEDNLNTYSFEFMKIIVSASIEFETVSKKIFNTIKMKDTWIKLESNKYHLIDFELKLRDFDLSIMPFKKIDDEKAFIWWDAYTSAKHDKINSLHKSSLKNALSAVGSLMILLIYIYKYSWRDYDSTSIEFKKGCDIWNQIEDMRKEPILFNTPNESDKKDGRLKYKQFWRTSFKEKA